jgi:hypothetical protein
MRSARVAIGRWMPGLLVAISIALGCASPDAGGEGVASEVDVVDAEACGKDYPSDFPCLGGGRVLTERAELAFRMKSVAVLYDEPAAELSDRIVAAATRSGWEHTATERAPHPGGPRYRTRFSRGQKDLSVSVYRWKDSGQSALQLLMTVPPKSQWRDCAADC